MKSSHDGLIKLIAVFKLLKGGLLIVFGIGAFKLLHKDVAAVVEHWIDVIKLDPANRFVDAALARASMLNPGQIKKLGLGSFIYAGLFLTEGVGLWLLKRWAEWLTVIITSSLIPVEIYEIQRRLTPAKLVVLAINLAIVGYLIYRIRGKQSV